MKVSELAKDLNISDEIVLEKLRSLKLRAKDGDQDLNKAVAIVVRGELAKELAKGKIPTGRPKVEAKAEKKVEIPTAEAVEERPKKTTRAKKTVAVEKKAEPVVEKKKAATKAKKIEKPTKVEKQEKLEKKEVEVKAQPKPEPKPAPVVPLPVPKMEPAPFVALKPLPKKRRRISARGEGEHGAESISAAESAESKSDATVANQPATEFSAAVAEIPLKELELNIPISVKDFAVSVNEKPSIVLKKLIQLGIFAHINQNLDEEIVKRLAPDFGFQLTKIKTPEEQLVDVHKEEEDDPKLLQSRAPVVTLMGHVDHGKTTLLDNIRKARVADQEHGGITQHIGAYSVSLPKGKITFLDTPGHEAFTAMRSRGAHITDLVVLVVAADEGVMPQTDEAINHARAAGVPIVVALTKIDKPNLQLDRVKKQLAERDLAPEDWGGKTVMVGVSGLTGEGIDNLLEMILLEAELLQLKANPAKRAAGIVVEAHLSGGKGAVASLIVQSGTLQVQDLIVAGPYYGKVKALFDHLERPIQEAGPSTPVEILGLPDVPEAGEKFYVVADEKQARDITTIRQEKLKKERLGASGKKITLEDLYAHIKEGKVKELNVILKADVQGSVEALKDSIAKIPSEEVKVKFIHTGVGDITPSDVVLAVASSAIIIAFHVAISPKAQEELEKNPVDVREYRIIYDAVNDVRKALEGLLAPQERRRFLARVEVRQVFNLSKSGIIAGCYVSKGRIPRKARVDVIRNGQAIYSGALSSLKRFKDDVREVTEGYECGIGVEGFHEYQPGDIFEIYDIEKIARTL